MDDVDYKRLIFSLGALLIFKEAFEILKAQGGIESTIGIVTLLPISAFLTLYLILYGFSLSSTLREKNKNWFKEGASDFFDIAFEITILFISYFVAAMSVVLITGIFKLLGAPEIITLIGLVLAPFIALGVHLIFFDHKKSPLYKWNYISTLVVFVIMLIAFAFRIYEKL